MRLTPDQQEQIDAAAALLRGDSRRDFLLAVQYRLRALPRITDDDVVGAITQTIGVTPVTRSIGELLGQKHGG